MFRIQCLLKCVFVFGLAILLAGGLAPTAKAGLGVCKPVNACEPEKVVPPCEPVHACKPVRVVHVHPAKPVKAVCVHACKPVEVCKPVEACKPVDTCESVKDRIAFHFRQAIERLRSKHGRYYTYESGTTETQPTVAPSQVVPSPNPPPVPPKAPEPSAPDKT
jgi:hypothetical protein